jgi:hypothetical protein
MFSAEGEWLDDKMRCPPRWADRHALHQGPIFQILGGLGDQAELFIQKVTGNPNADFCLSCHHHDVPWFCLVGAIGSGGVSNFTILKHESFRIDSGPVTYTPRESGYFYAYANYARGLLR